MPKKNQHLNNKNEFFLYYNAEYVKSKEIPASTTKF
jgi:hypothetical protein